MAEAEMIETKTVHEMAPDKATQTKRDCVCSDCFAELLVRYDPKTRLSTVTCVTDGCPCHGFVTRSWVERAKAENRAQAIEAKRVLSAAVPWMAGPKRTEKDLLAELGF